MDDVAIGIRVKELRSKGVTYGVGLSAERGRVVTRRASGTPKFAK